MTRTRINLNADIAEGFGAYQIGDDAALIRYIGSANVACGMHGGDWNTMHRFCMLAAERGVSVGAHPGFNDVHGFGRRQIRMPAGELEHMIAYQIGALQAIARYAGLSVTHLKAHGALNNMAATDEGYARAIGAAIRAVDPTIIYVAQAATMMERVGRDMGLRVAREGFADRQYENDLTLASRAIPGTVIRDPATAAAQALSMAQRGEVVSRHGQILKLKVDTICIHGDEPTAVAVAAAVAQALDEAGIARVSIPDMLA